MKKLCMGNESEYIDFWLTTSHDSHFNSSYSASNTPNPKLFESKKKLKVHYFIGGSAIMLSLTGYALTILPLFIPLFYVWPLGDMLLFFVCHAMSMLLSFIIMYKIESNIKDHVKFDRYKLCEQVYTCKTAVRFWSNVYLTQFILSIAPSIIIFIIWDHCIEYRPIYEELTFLRWWAELNNKTIPISMAFAIVLPITNGILTLYYKGIHMNIDELISKNETFIKANKDVNSVNIGILSELFNNKKLNAKLYFSNGCYLMTSNEPHKNKHGYILFDKQGNKQEFIFEEHAQSFSDMVKNGHKIYEHIIEEINKALMEKSIEEINA